VVLRHSKKREFFSFHRKDPGVKYPLLSVKEAYAMLSRVSVCTFAAIFVVAAAIAPSANAAPSDDACSYLTQAQVIAAVAVPVGAGTYVTPTFKKTCTWTPTGDEKKTIQSVTLLLQTADAFEFGKKLGDAKNVVITPVSGAGDDAYFLAIMDAVSLIVKKGNAAFKVTVYARGISVEKKEAMEKTLAMQIVSKL
jgi:hypothetical protein